LHDARGDLLRVVGRRQVLAEDHELVAAEPGDDVARPDHRLQPPSGLRQHPVAGLMAEDVVHVLEAVEVHIEDGEGPACALGAEHRTHQQLVEEFAVGQPGERVVGGLVLELVLVELADGRVTRDQREHLDSVHGGRGERHVDRHGRLVLASRLDHMLVLLPSNVAQPAATVGNRERRDQVADGTTDELRLGP